jgi:hypothetical protein
VLSAPNLTRQGPKERGEHKELTERLGPEEGSPEKEIGRRGGAPTVSSGGGAVAVREERRGGRGMERRFGLALYRAEGEVERTDEAVARRFRRWPVPLMAAALGAAVTGEEGSGRW